MKSISWLKPEVRLNELGISDRELILLILFLLDEPTSALDVKNRQVVVELLTKKKKQGCALIGIFHDREVRDKLCTQELLFEDN